MDDIDKQLQFEELRLIFNDIKNGINSLKDLLGSNLQITIPDNIAVDSKVILENKIDSLDISNLHILKEWIEDQTNQLRSVIKENKPETQRDIIVKNLKDIPKVESVTIKNWSDFDKFTKSVVNAIKENKSEVNVTKQEIKLPTSAKEPISVRLSDGKSFYNAIAAMTSGLQIPRIQSTTTPAVYGVPVVNPDGSNIGGSASTGNITDGVDTAIKATVKDLTNSNPLATQIMDANGDAITSFGGGTQYTEDAAAAANPVGTAPMLVRSDTPTGAVTTDGDNVAQRGTNYGAAYTQIVTSTGAFVDTFGGGSQYTEGDVDATITGTAALVEGAGNALAPLTQPLTDTQLRATAVPVSGTFWQATQPISGTVTANLSATDNAVLDAIELDTTTIAGAVSGTEMQVDVVTSALPTGASTLAEQQTQTTALQLIDDSVYTDGVGTVTKGIAVLGQDGTNPQAIKTDSNGELQVDVLSMPTTTVTATDLDIRNLTNTDVVTAELSAVDNAVLDSIAAKDFATQTTLSTLNAKFVTGTDIGDVTINNASGASAVNIQDGGNSITVDGAVTVSGTATVSATDLDIRNLAPATDTVAIGDGTSTATVRNLAANDALNVAITDGSGNQITSFGGGTQYTEGDTDASITGTALMMEGAANALVAAPGTAADGLLVNLGANNDVTVTSTVAVTQSGTWDEVGINDSGNSITVDNPQLSVVGSGTEATAMRVTIATDSTGVLSVDDNGSSLTVDGTVTANLAAGTNNIGDVDVLTLPVAYNAGTTSATTVRTVEATAATSTLSNVAGSASSVTLIAANTARKKVVMYNDSTADCYVKYGSAATSSSFTWLMAAGSHIEETDYNGIITGIWTSATGNMRVTEIST